MEGGWFGKRHCHGGNVRVITGPDGWPLLISEVRPGRKHDTATTRGHPELLTMVDAWRADGRTVLADLG